VESFVGLVNEGGLVGVSDGDGEAVGSVVGARNGWEFEESTDHFLDLGLLGAAVAGDGLLDLHGGVFARDEAGLGEGEQDNAAGLADGDGGGDVGGEEKHLDRGLVGVDLGEHLRELSVERDEALGHGGMGGRGDHAGVDKFEATVVVLNDAEASGGGARIYPDNSHGYMLTDGSSGAGARFDRYNSMRVVFHYMEFE
jgi:hypothetical protein